MDNMIFTLVFGVPTAMLLLANIAAELAVARLYFKNNQSQSKEDLLEVHP